MMMLRFVVVGHVQIQKIYAACAARDASRSAAEGEQGVPMSPADLIRNYIFEHFDGEEEQKQMYEQPLHTHAQMHAPHSSLASFTPHIPP
jgi:hypothetical protein